MKQLLLLLALGAWHGLAMGQSLYSHYQGGRVAYRLVGDQLVALGWIGAQSLAKDQPPTWLGLSSTPSQKSQIFCWINLFLVILASKPRWCYWLLGKLLREAKMRAKLASLPPFLPPEPGHTAPPNQSAPMKDDIKIDFSSALRPGFTELIWGKLSGGRETSVNVYSPKRGLGKTRLLQDLREILKPHVPIALVSIKDWRHDYQKFVESVNKQWNVPDQEKQTPEDRLRRFLPEQANQLFILLLDDFEALLDTAPLPKDLQPFFDFLNWLKNHENVGFCAVSPRRVDVLAVGSPIRFSCYEELLPLRALDELIPELKRQLPEPTWQYLQTQMLMEPLLQKIQAHSRPYDWLKYLVSRLQREADLPERQGKAVFITLTIPRWEKEYAQSIQKAPDKQLAEWDKKASNLSEWASKIVQITGLPKAWGWLKKLPLWQKLLGGFTSSGGTLVWAKWEAFKPYMPDFVLDLFK
jgi:hypothetical protein